MMNPYAHASEHPFRAVFAPVVWWRSYSRLLYLLLTLPIGLVYFTVYVTGAALGVGLLIMTIGAAILALLVVATRPIAHFERFLARALVGESIAPVPAPRTKGSGFWRWLQGVMQDSVTWKTLAFALIRFPLGLVSWVAVVVLVSTSLALVVAPVVEPFGGEVTFGAWSPSTALEYALISLSGLIGFVAVIHIVNGLAVAWAKLTRVSVTRGGGDLPPVPTEAAAPPRAPNMLGSGSSSAPSITAPAMPRLAANAA